MLIIVFFDSTASLKGTGTPLVGRRTFPVGNYIWARDCASVAANLVSCG
jgi:hypothetical protein